LYPWTRHWSISCRCETNGHWLRRRLSSWAYATCLQLAEMPANCAHGESSYLPRRRRPQRILITIGSIGGTDKWIVDPRISDGGWRMQHGLSPITPWPCVWRSVAGMGFDTCLPPRVTTGQLGFQCDRLAPHPSDVSQHAHSKSISVLSLVNRFPNLPVSNTGTF